MSDYHLSEFVQLGMVKDQVPQSIGKVLVSWLLLLEKRQTRLAYVPQCTKMVRL